MLFAGVPIYLACLFQEETSKKIILQRRAKKFNLPPPHDPKMLLTEPIVAYFSIYSAFNFAVLFGFFACEPYVYTTTYNFSIGEAGLVFLATGVGCLLATYLFVEINKRTYVRQALERMEKKDPRPVPPEERLYPAMFGCFLVPIGLFWFAWTARPKIHWIVPTLSFIVFNCGNLMVFDTGKRYSSRAKFVKKKS